MGAGDIHDVTVNNRAIPGEPVIFSILSAISCLLVVVRIYTRFWVKRALGWDDYTIIPAFVCSNLSLRCGSVEYPCYIYCMVT